MLLGVQPVQGEKPDPSSTEPVETVEHVREPESNETAGIENAGSEALREWIANAGSEALHDFGFDTDMRRQECHAK